MNTESQIKGSAGPVVLYDGVCGLCSRAVRWLIAHDHLRTLRYAPLQGTTAASLRRQYPEIPDSLDSVVLIEDGRVFLRSKAFLHVSRYLNTPWRWSYRVRWLPAWPLNLGYRLVARTRYKLWGKVDLCELPSPANADLMLP